MDITEFRQALSADREEVVQRYLAQHCKILIRSFFPTGTYLCLPKFRFGISYVSDFLLIQLWSTRWHDKLILVMLLILFYLVNKVLFLRGLIISIKIYITISQLFFLKPSFVPRVPGGEG